MTPISEGAVARDCMLCRAERITPWYHEDDVCWIAQCEICEVPMVVWRSHGVEPPAADRDHMLARQQTEHPSSDALWVVESNEEFCFV